MTSIGELFPKCRKLAYDARQQLAMIQQQQQQQQQSPASLHMTTTSRHHHVSELYLVLEELNRQLDSMEQLLLREIPAQRQVWKHKISELRQEAANLQQQGQAAQLAAQRLQYSSSYQKEREELLRRRRRRGGGEGEDDMQNLATESTSLENSNTAVLGLISQGEANLSGLVEQRQRLRGVRRVLTNIGSSLGITQSTMRIIERRDITDAYLVLGGMVVTLLVIYFVWF